MTSNNLTERLVAEPPAPERSVVAVKPPGAEAGCWAGAPSAVVDGSEIVLAYRLRRPADAGRGYAVAIARSADGVRFETIQVISKDELNAESLERPALVQTPEGSWRLYLSCATWGTKHWRVELLEATAPDLFDARRATMVLPGDSGRAVKDPVIINHQGTWHLWASVHPLGDPANTDRMAAEYATSADGLRWTWHGVALAPRPGAWDSRGVRVTAVRFVRGGVVAFYDGRSSAAENFEERTGVAVGRVPGSLSAVGSAPVAQAPVGDRGLRYLDVVDLGAGRERIYYEMTRPDGRHELRTELRELGVGQFGPSSLDKPEQVPAASMPQAAMRTGSPNEPLADEPLAGVPGH